MPRVAALIGLLVLSASCGLFRGGAAASRSGTTAVWGDWVMRTPDSTSFIGAERVELQLQPGTFALTAVYPDRTPLRITGTAAITTNGILTLTPQQGADAAAQARVPQLRNGQAIVLIASASGGTLVFAPAGQETLGTPSSVWHRATAAGAAGIAAGARTP